MKAFPLFLLTCLLATSLPAVARDEKEPPAAPQMRVFSPQQFMREQEAFIIRESGITPLEAAKFFPAFQKLQSELRAINQNIRKCMRQTRNVELTEDEAQTILKKIDKLNQQKVKKENEFHEKAQRIIGARKTLRVISAERRFDREVLQKMMRKRK